jgi:Leucine-rich repeat (LRR) protein
MGENLELINLRNNALSSLHRATFEGWILVLIDPQSAENLYYAGLSNLRYISLNNNKLSAMHPKSFSNLANLCELQLANNVCIDRDFYFNPSKATIENELQNCKADYKLLEHRSV